MARPKFFTNSLAALALLSSAGPAVAQSATAGSNVTIVPSVGFEIVRDVLGDTNAALIILGSVGDALSISVPSSVFLSTAGGDDLTIGAASQLSSDSLVLSEDTVSVNIGAIVNGETAAAPPGTYGGILVVLAQYN